jgi:hypothetical protein
MDTEMKTLFLDRRLQFERRTNEIWESEQRPITRMDFTKENFIIDGITYQKFTEAGFYKYASILEKEDKLFQLKKTIPAHYFPISAKFRINHIEDAISNLSSLSINHQSYPSSPITDGVSFSIKFIEETIWKDWALHNIHLAAFNVKDIHSSLKAKDYSLTKHSRDIQLKPIHHKGLIIKPIVHNTDTITVSVGCSYSPIIMNAQDVTRLDNGLGQMVEELSIQSDLGNIPYHSDWLCTGYHFGRDGENLFRGQAFEILWRDAKKTYHHIYTKKYNDGYHLRDETYGYPFAKLEQVLNSKMIVSNY